MSFLLKAATKFNNTSTASAGLRCLSAGLNYNNGTNNHNHQQFRFNSQNATNFRKPKTNNAIYTLFSLGGIVLGYCFFDNMDRLKKAEMKSLETKTKPQKPQDTNNEDVDVETARKWHQTERKDLPTYKMAEVNKHNTLEKGIWVTYGIGVYDITKFIPNHPGSDKIMLGAGSAIDPFWAIYQQHNNKEILKLLESFRIGNISPEEEISTDDMGSPWANEPKRHPLLKPASERPFNAEPPLSLLAEHLYTPNEFFYVRNHLPVPVIDPDSYELEIEISTPKAGAKEKYKTLTYEDIKKLPKHTVTAAIMCGGNRRSEMTKFKSVKGKGNSITLFNLLIIEFVCFKVFPGVLVLWVMPNGREHVYVMFY